MFANEYLIVIEGVLWWVHGSNCAHRLGSKVYQRSSQGIPSIWNHGMRFEAVMHVGCSHQGSRAYAWGQEEALQALWAFHSLQLSERTRRRKTGRDEFTESSFIKWPVCVNRLHWPWLHLEHLREIDAVICCCIAIAAWIHQVLSQTFCCWSSSFHWEGAKAQHIKRHQCVPTRGNWLMTDSRPAAVHRLPLLLPLSSCRSQFCTTSGRKRLWFGGRISVTDAAAAIQDRDSALHFKLDGRRRAWVAGTWTFFTLGYVGSAQDHYREDRRGANDRHSVMRTDSYIAHTKLQ